MKLKILIIEDTPERQDILTSLFRDHAWILVHTVARAKNLLDAYAFDLIALDYDLADDKKGDEVARHIKVTCNDNTLVLVHSMNNTGVFHIQKHLPNSLAIPISKITRDNQTFKRMREELTKGLDINWSYVFQKK